MRTPSNRAGRRAAAFFLIATTVAACGSTPGASSGSGAGTGNPGSGTSTPGGQTGSNPAAAAQFGLAPKPGGDVTYQPDVVFIERGAEAIRSVTSDGLTWTIDRRAPGVENVTTGVVLYLTSLAVGRVVRVQEVSADDLAVTLAPVDLGEVIKDGNIRIDQDIDLAGWGLRSIADTPGLLGELAPLAPEATQAASSRSTDIDRFGTQRAYLAPFPEGPAGVPALDILPTMPPPYNQGDTTWEVGDWSGRVARTGGDIAFTVATDGDLKWAGKVVFHFTQPHLDADIGIVDGEVGNGEIRLRGLRQIALGLQAGSVNGLGDNTSEKVELPVSLDTPVIVGGVAMNLNVTFKFLIQTAFTAKNSTIEAVGAWDTEGPLSYSRESGAVEVSWPTVTPNPNILDSLKSISIGTTGIVFATSIKVMLGLGVPAFNAGPYAQVVTSVALATGSSIGFAGEAMKCRQATVTVQGSFGAGLTVGDTVGKALNAYLSQLATTTRVDTDNQKPFLSEPLYSHSFWSPDVEYCRLGT